MRTTTGDTGCWEGCCGYLFLSCFDWIFFPFCLFGFFLFFFIFLSPCLYYLFSFSFFFSLVFFLSPLPSSSFSFSTGHFCIVSLSSQDFVFPSFIFLLFSSFFLSSFFHFSSLLSHNLERERPWEEQPIKQAYPECHNRDPKTENRNSLCPVSRYLTAD